MGAADRDDVALLLRRAGFGATGAEIDAASAAGFDATVDAVVGSLTAPDAAADSVPAPPLTAPAPLGAGASTEQRQARNADLRQQATAIVDWWVARMLVASHPATEKFAWFWHGHFATSIDKVQRADLMYRQNQIFRQLGAGDFTTLTTAVGQDPAMLVWLDADTDVAAHPNENFARELMELFTLGIGNYTETGCEGGGPDLHRVELRPHDPCVHGAEPPPRRGRQDAARPDRQLRRHRHDPARHDVAGGGAVRGRSDLVALRDGDHAGRSGRRRPGRNVAIGASGRCHAARGFHPSAVPDGRRSGRSGQATDRMGHRSVAVARSDGRHVRQRADAKVAVATRTVLAGLGQTPFRPPSVGGWPADEAWLNTAADQIKLRFARVVSAAAAATPAGKDLAATAAGDRPAHLAWLLGLDGWQPPTAAALATVAADPISLMVFGLTSPDYQLA